MKTFQCLLLVALFAGATFTLSACHLVGTGGEDDHPIYGTWEVVRVQGGIMGMDERYDDSGILYRYSQTGIFTLREADTLAVITPFTLRRDSGRDIVRYAPPGNRTLPDEWAEFLPGDTLVLTDYGISDGFVKWLVRTER